MVKLPEEFLCRMKDELGAEFPSYMAAMELPPMRSLRVNTLKADAGELYQYLGFNPVPNGVCDEGFLVPNDFDVKRSAAHAMGLYYMQDASAQLPAKLLDVKPGMRVLDLCAAPGGKTTQLAAGMCNRGILVANEPVYSRAKVLTGNLERLGVTCAVVCCERPDALSKRFQNYFDAVLADAPCSGEGMFRKEPNAAGEWSVSQVETCARRQSNILESAAAMLKEGGRLMYSTCTFSKEENENVIDEFLSRNRDFRLLSFSRLYPHSCMGEGQTAALLMKGETAHEIEPFAPAPAVINRRLYPELYSFANEYLDMGKLPHGTLIGLQDGRSMISPLRADELGGLRVLRSGLLLGELRGKLFMPAHALAMAARDAALVRRLELGDDELVRYFAGESLPSRELRGWAAACCRSKACGLVKCGADAVKNHYPKGLRTTPGK
ncbi:MAG TPA: RsmB/NOP family class I SAM-dependent RNA methyltransferase [Clostridia bacterium]|nr:RsmB/NOP family class I SAM-dependent RNA methyltransferase [Clostridia bacterium]